MKKHTFILIFISVFGLAIHSLSQAFEIDSFYRRNQALKDSTDALNAEVNKRIASAVSLTSGCSFEELYTNVRNQINANSSGFGVIGGMEGWAEKNPKLDKIEPPPREQSVYFGTSFESVTSMGFWLNLYKSVFDRAKSSAQAIKSTISKIFGNQENPIQKCQVPGKLKSAAENFLAHAPPGGGGPPPNGPPPGGPPSDQGGFSASVPHPNGPPEGMGSNQHSEMRALQDSGVLECLMKESPRGNGPGDGGAGNLEPVISLAGSRIGVDKLGHFFDQGAEYFREAYEIKGEKIINKADGLSKALKLGRSQEEGMFGLASVGIKSYGDLAANYGGFLFWHKLGASNDPLVKCQAGRFQVVKQFDFKNFVTDAWDEGINCSEYKNDEMKNRVETNLKNLKLSCPVEVSKCAHLISQYDSKVLAEIASPACSITTTAPTSIRIGGVLFETPEVEKTRGVQ